MDNGIKKINVLSVSQCLLYESVPHAGGKTYYYYMSRIAHDPAFSLHVICHCVKGEESKADFKKLGITGTVLFSKGSFFINVRRVLLDLYGRLTGKTCLDSWYKQAGYRRELRKLKKQGYTPDIIILEWTCCAALSKYCKELFPDAKVIASEHDVSFLGARRRADLAKGKDQRLNNLAEATKDEELDTLSCCDMILPHNEKDRQLLLDSNVPEEKIHTIVPYYQSMGSICRNGCNKDILFWGAMSREENIQAVNWFIDQVLPLIHDPEVRFVVVGNKPPQELIEKADRDPRIIVTGFVEDPVPFFESSLCFAAPLLTGAGIKVKVLEALSAGIPVLTNTIGIEGIPAKDKEDYFFCMAPQDYASVIQSLAHGEIDTEKLCRNSRRVINNHFDLEQSGQNYLQMLKSF